MKIIEDYKKGHLLPPGLASLYTSRSILLIAGGFVGLFLPVYLLIQYQSLEKVIVYYLISFGLYIFTATPGAIFMNYIGIRNSIIWAFPFLAGYFASLYFFETDIVVFTVLSLLFITVYRMLYWVPYHTEFTKLSDKKNRGKQISILDSFTSLLGIIIPFVSALLIKSFGFQMVFIIVIILILVGIIPLLFVPKINVKFTWSHKQCWKEFFKKDNRKMMIAYMGDGAENFVGAVLWPIFMWQLLNGEYLSVGLIASLVTLVAVVVRLVMGDFTDKFSKRKLMKIGSILYSFGWIVKIFITSAFHIFLASTYHNFALIILRTPFDALMYEKAADAGHFVDEYSTLREMYLQTGRVIIMILILIMLNFVSINVAFFLAAMASLLVNLLPKNSLHEKASIR
ncbi:MFS transporter [bacterium]|jgi:MFS family permease|nr:MFS transporter [bacterium]MBT4122038.1 MFS transporter [bacterium]MBT4335118.1 MFS transporter [bacterium]MBT4495216.1 MFS transporter [bacterium]MBT4763550.1 MFS transporter [bacterium]